MMVVWTLAAGVVVLVILFSAVVHKLVTTAEHGEKLYRQLRDSQRQRTRLADKLNRTTMQRDALGRRATDLQGDIEVMTPAFADLSADHDKLVRDYKKLNDKHSLTVERLTKIEQDPRYEDGCQKQGAFRLEADAQLFADHLSDKEGVEYVVYPCPQCREFFTGNTIFHVAHAKRTGMVLRMARGTGLDQKNLDVLRSKMA